MKFTAIAGLLAVAPLATAHTLFSRFYVDGESQGDGTCIRQPIDSSKCTAPIDGLTSDDMACGKDGEIPAAFVCPTSASATLTFEFRVWPDARVEGSIDGSHRGPCAVYVKRLDDMFSDKAAGPGWTKVWHEGYDEDAGKWCTEKLIDNQGLFSFELPSGLAAGYYLVRPELLALHQAASMNDPQYYVGCAQIYIQDGPATSNIPDEHTVSIPGYMDGSEPGNSFNVYERPMALPYLIPGPEPFSPVGTASGSVSLNATEIDGAIPGDCVVKNSNWCGEPLPPYSGSSGCWAAVEACFAQGSTCFADTAPTGKKNCERWNKEMCHIIQAECRAGNFEGPPVVQIEEYEARHLSPVPSVVNKGAGNSGSNPGSGSGSEDDEDEDVDIVEESTTAAPAPVATSSPSEDDQVTASPIFSTISYDAPAVSSASPIEQGEEEEEEEETASSILESEPATSTTSTESQTSAALPVSSSPSSTPEPDSGLVASPDGTCGGDTGYTCEGSRFGGCCSRFGRCGRRTRACGCKCQPLFGRCNDVSEA